VIVIPGLDPRPRALDRLDAHLQPAVAPVQARGKEVAGLILRQRRIAVGGAAVEVEDGDVDRRRAGIHLDGVERDRAGGQIIELRRVRDESLGVGVIPRRARLPRPREAGALPVFSAAAGAPGQLHATARQPEFAGRQDPVTGIADDRGDAAGQRREGDFILGAVGNRCDGGEDRAPPPDRVAALEDDVLADRPYRGEIDRSPPLRVAARPRVDDERGARAAHRAREDLLVVGPPGETIDPADAVARAPALADDLKLVAGEVARRLAVEQQRAVIKKLDPVIAVVLDVIDPAQARVAELRRGRRAAVGRVDDDLVGAGRGRDVDAVPGAGEAGPALDRELVDPVGIEIGVGAGVGEAQVDARGGEVEITPLCPGVLHGSCPMGHSVALLLTIALRSRSASHNGMTRS
jgi:hypothetical protein